MSEGKVLNNTYFVLRHGQSEANEQSLIVSCPDIGTSQFGLTELGREQVLQTVSRHKEELLTVSRIVASDFLRTMQTASIVAHEIGLLVHSDANLRERFFGRFDQRISSNYQTVWDYDESNPQHQEFGVESVDSVAQRMMQSVRALEKKHCDETILLVSHGDPLNILLLAANQSDAARHRYSQPLETAELRRLCG